MRSFVFLFSLILALVAFAMASNQLQIDVTKDGSGTRKTVAGDTIAMHYRGTLPNDGGRKFDASYDRNEPLTFKLGAGQVIKGWDEGLKDMKIGEKRTLTIPPSMGYGASGFPPVIPANAVLQFETELVSIAGHKEL